MAKLTIEWIETKGPDWKVASLIGEDKTAYKDVSINRTSKKGEIFPNFDDLKNGGEVEGELWQSTGQKWYLFPPKPQTTSGGAPRGSGGGYKQKVMEESMARKESSIRNFQATKEESIRLSSAQRDSVLIVTSIGVKESSDDEIKHAIIKWRDWFLLSSEFNDTPPFES